METYSPKKKILPCLLDRLTDRYPKAIKESREFKVVNLKQYRAALARDLEFLFNNLTRPDEKMLEGFGYVQESVVNYGVRDFSGDFTGTQNTARLIAAIKEAIIRYEPRILKETLTIRKSKPKDHHQKSKAHFDIEGELWAEPICEKLFIKTEFDLETGECRVS